MRTIFEPVTVSCSKIAILLIVVTNCYLQDSFAQEYLFPLNRDLNTRIEPYYEQDSVHFHSAMKPFTMAEVRHSIPVDSILAPDVKASHFNSTWVGRKLRREHFLYFDKDDLKLSVDPVFNFQGGRDLIDKKNVYVNTKGILIQGSVKDKFYFYSGFHENQADYADYIDEFISGYSVVPGQGKIKHLVNKTGYDFSMSYGGVGYTLNKHFDFQLLHDKNFVGDGYRSVLLSDNAYNYPFLKINTTFWKIKYTVIYAFMQDMIASYNPDVGFKKKYATFHYLDVNIGKRERLSAGLFEAVIWKHDNSRGYEVSYLNPVLFLRPVENSLDSPDNALLGFNLKYRASNKHIFYGQLMLDEFLLNEVRSGHGWYANKQAFQLGYKGFQFLGIKNLNVQTEFNFVRPFTYQHRSTGQNYAHYNQALAHPYGANFYESVSFVNYRWRNFFVEAKYIYSQIGRDYLNSNVGNNIFMSYETHSSEYHNYVAQGVVNTLNYREIKLSYLLNPKTNFVVEAGVSDRKNESAFDDDHARIVFFGIRTALENYYFDF